MPEINNLQGGTVYFDHELGSRSSAHGLLEYVEDGSHSRHCE
jgi:hypothetical protein